jgi:hypothetical protein
MFTREKFYSADRELILNAICDLAEMQGGREIFSDPRTGRAGFRFVLDGRELEYRFVVTDVENGCNVTLEMMEAVRDSIVERAFFLLESILPESVVSCGILAEDSRVAKKPANKIFIYIAIAACVLLFSGVAVTNSDPLLTSLRREFSGGNSLFARPTSFSSPIVRIETTWESMGLMTADDISGHRLEIDRASRLIKHVIYTRFGEETAGSYTYEMDRTVCENFFEWLSGTANVNEWKKNYTISMLDGYAWEFVIVSGKGTRAIEGSETPPRGEEVEKRIWALASFKVKPNVF